MESEELILSINTHDFKEYKTLIKNILITQMEENIENHQVAVAINNFCVRKSGPLLETDSVSADIYRKFILENQDIIDINLGAISNRSNISKETLLNKEKIF